MKKFISFIAALLLLGCTLLGLVSCGDDRETITIYTSAEDYRVTDMTQKLEEKFPNYKFNIQYMTSGNHSARLYAEGVNTDCDITYDLEYCYLAKLDAEGFLADLSSYDSSIYTDDTIVSKTYLPEYRNGGAIIVNTKVLEAESLAEPTCYADLLKPEYKDLISMPSPKSSGTGYMFLRQLANEWGEEEAFAYFDALAENIVSFTSSGSGPVNALIQEQVAIGLGMTGQAVTKINEGETNLKVLYFEEGSPYSLYGQAIIKGKEERTCVKEVFDYLINEYAYEMCEAFFPEKIFKDRDFVIKNYPTDIPYGDMSNNTLAEKERLLAKWSH